ncbi:MAG: exo-alpha-sialidase [Bacteroidota bacterium]
MSALSAKVRRLIPYTLITALFLLQGLTVVSQVTPARSFKTTLPAGIGNEDERLVAFRVVAESGTESLKKIKLNLSETTELSDLTVVKVYFNGSKERFDPVNAMPIATVTSVKSEMTLTVDMPLTKGENWFWITADISGDATEGNQIGASVLSCKKGDGVTIPVLEPEGTRTILLTSQLLFSCGDGGSKSYRIPAIVTARDGSLVTATDKRWTGSIDLPNPIDVVIRRSTDKGHSWSDAVTIAGNGTDTGYGDPALVVNRQNGDIICLFASDKGWYTSTAAEPIRINQSISTDNGLTWSEPQDITAQIYGASSSDPVTRAWQGAFVTSGAATQLRSGRIMAVLAARETIGMDISNFVIYSDDGAQTWKVSTNRAFARGDEAKVTQLDNGDVLMSIRQSGNRWFNISRDQGMTWGTPFRQTDIIDPFCNGDLISYTAVSDGYDKNRLLHSIPFANSRKNVSVLLSYDEGKTWPVQKTIYSGESAYSSLTILDDGTIGIYFEVGEYEIFQMYFMRFSLKWLTDGADQWLLPVSQPVTVQLPGSASVTYIANEGFLIETVKHKVIVDALFGNINGDWCDQPGDSLLQCMINGKPPFDHIDAVLVTHKHVDHFDAGLVSEFMKKHTESVLICPGQVADLLLKHQDSEKYRERIQAMKSGIPFDTLLQVDDLIVRPYRLNHGVYMATDEKTGQTENIHKSVENIGYLVGTDGFTFFHSGDASTGDIQLFKDYGLGEQHCDLAFFDRTFMRPEGMKIINEVIKPDNLVLMHLEPGRKEYYQSVIKDIPGMWVFKAKMENRSFSN